MVRRFWLLALAAAVFAAGCGSDDGSSTTVTDPTPTTTTSGPTTSTAPDALDEGYAAWLRLDAAGARDVSIVPVFRPSSIEPTLEQRIMTLLAGYTFSEAGFGIGTEIPFETQVLFVDGPIDGGVTVNLSAPFGADADPEIMRTRLAQLVFTATEHPGVDRVAVLVEGELPPPAEGLDVSVPLARGDLVWALERVALLQPMMLQTGVGSSISLAGLADADEIEFEVVDGAGSVLASGRLSTDAPDATGLRPFSAFVDMDPAPPGDLCTIHVWVDAPRRELAVPFYAAE